MKTLQKLMPQACDSKQVGDIVGGGRGADLGWVGAFGKQFADIETTHFCNVWRSEQSRRCRSGRNRCISQTRRPFRNRVALLRLSHASGIAEIGVFLERERRSEIARDSEGCQASSQISK